MKKQLAFMLVMVLSLALIGLPKANAAKVEEQLYKFDFESLSEGTTLPAEFTWNNVGTAKIVTHEGSKVLELAAGGYNYIFIGDSIEGDFVIELKIKVTDHKAKGGAQFTFREDKSKNNARYGYHVCYGDTTNTAYGLELRKRVMNDFSEKVNTPLTYDGAWHTFKVEVVGGNVKLYMDGNKVADQAMTGYESGHVTISSYLETALFDDIKISKLVEKTDPAPTTEPDTNPQTNPQTNDSGMVIMFAAVAVIIAAVVFKKKVTV